LGIYRVSGHAAFNTDDAFLLTHLLLSQIFIEGSTFLFCSIKFSLTVRTKRYHISNALHRHILNFKQFMGTNWIFLKQNRHGAEKSRINRIRCKLMTLLISIWGITKCWNVYIIIFIFNKLDILCNMFKLFWIEDSIYIIFACQ